MQAPYETGDFGQPKAAVPGRCPVGADGSECRVGVHSTRVRKTGPCVPLVVARCHRHEIYFTVYPPGHVPYGRAAVLPLDLAGRRVDGRNGASFATADTLWQATADAAADERWPETGGLRGCRRTQGRRLELGADLLGLRATARTREQSASALRLPALVLHEAAATVRAQSSWRERASVVMQLLGRCLGPNRSAQWLLAAGEVAGLWGRPSRWDPGGARLVPLV